MDLDPGILDSLPRRFAASWPAADWADVNVLVAVSGGADSIALARLMLAVRQPGAGELFVAHVNHRLRAAASDDDEAFVARFCQQHGIHFRAAAGDPRELARREGDGIEAAARATRYAALEHFAAQVGARYVALAHTADDQAETILHRVARGTGLAGLRGMPRTRRLGHAALIRPLLGMRRSELREYLAALGQPYREDASNALLAHVRNRLRHQVLPPLAEHVNADVTAALVRLGEMAVEVGAVIDPLVEQLAQRAVRTLPRDANESRQENERPRDTRHRPDAADGAAVPTSDDIDFPPQAMAEAGRADTQRVIVDGRVLTDQPRYLVRELLVRIWRERHWPRQQMSYAQWERLADLLLAREPAASAVSLPGGILARRRGDWLELSR